MLFDWIRRPATIALVAILGSALLAAQEVNAQISFGKMRDAAEKSNGAPKVEDDEESAAFDVKPDEKGTAQSATKTAPKHAQLNRGRSTSSRAVAREQAQEAQTKTNGVANALSRPLVEEEDEPEAAVPEPAPETPKPGARAKSEPSVDNRDAADASNGKRGPILGKAISHKYRAGMIFRAAANGTCSNVIGTAPVPMDFPEQKVRTLEEEFPRVAKVDYRDVKEGGARQLVFKMRELKAGQGVQATALYEVVRYPLQPPTEPEIYEIPKKPTTEIRKYLKNGPYIESTSKTVRTLAKETVGDIDGAWDKVDAIFQYVRDNVQYKEILINKPMRGALAAIKAREGDCEDMCALFIAMCRASEIPARLVRVPGHCWAEFYLVDDQKEGYWFPAQVAGTEPLGSLQDTRVILQKGDSFRLPETPKEESLYVKELFMGNVKEGGGDPEYQFIQETDPRD